MSIKAPQVLIFVVCAATMVAVLSVVRFAFTVQADGEYWNNLSGAGEKVAEMRAEEALTLSGGTMPIDDAMKQLSTRGRGGFTKIKPKSGEGMPPVAGWVHHPDFEARVKQAKEVEARIAEEKAAAALAAEQAPAEGAAQ